MTIHSRNPSLQLKCSTEFSVEVPSLSQYIPGNKKALLPFESLSSRSQYVNG